MKNKKKLFLILLDAFSDSYISKENTPFLFSKINNSIYVKKIIPSFGFCERAELFTGLPSSENGFLTAINISKSSPYKGIKLILKFIYFIPFLKNKLINKIIRRLLWIYSKIINNPMHPQNIPFNVLSNFALTEDFKDMSLRNALDKESIFDLAKKHNKIIDLSSFTAMNSKIGGNDNNRIDNLLKKIHENNDIYFLYISELDFNGHKYGPMSKNCKVAAKNVDNKLKKIFNLINDKFQKSEFIIIGDHGMDYVERSIDIDKYIKSISLDNKLKIYKDFFYFLDSTALRMWFQNDKAKNIFKQELKKINTLNDYGYFIDSHLKYKYKIPVKYNYGDLIWWAKSGNLIFPSFYTKSFIDKGMHGYINNKSFGFAMIIDNKTLPRIFDKKYLYEITDFIRNFITK